MVSALRATGESIGNCDFGTTKMHSKYQSEKNDFKGSRLYDIKIFKFSTFLGNVIYVPAVAICVTG